MINSNYLYFIARGHIKTRCECVVSPTGPGHIVSELDVSVLFSLQVLVIQYVSELDVRVLSLLLSWSYSIRTRCECVVYITGPGHTVSELDVSVLFTLQVLVIQYQN